MLIVGLMPTAGYFTGSQRRFPRQNLAHSLSLALFDDDGHPLSGLSALVNCGG